MWAILMLLVPSGEWQTPPPLLPLLLLLLVVCLLVWAVLWTVMYVVYNGQIIHSPFTYGVNQLYIKADVVYFVSAVFYLFGSMRDCGFFARLPLAGCRSLAQLDAAGAEEALESPTSDAGNVYAVESAKGETV